SIERRVAGRVGHRQHLADIAADDVEALQATDDDLGIAHAEASRFRDAGADAEHGVEAVDVEGDIGRSIAAYAARLLDHGLAPHLLEIVHRDDAHADVIAVLNIVIAEACAAQPDLDRSLRIDYLLFDQAAKRGRMIDLAAEERIEGVGMG